MVSIVGNELKMVERVTGRLSYPRVALSGALSGMWFGLFVGVMLSFFAPSPGYFSILTSVLMGAAFFMLFGIVTYAMQRGKRDFTSTSQVVATSYDVVVSPEAAHEARRLLQQLPMTRSDAAAGNGPYTQRDYQNQPYQQPGQGPVRPSGWNDPYGQSSGHQSSGSSVQETPAYGPPDQQPPDAGTQQQPSPARAVRYPDLPDGRPQYGVRLPQGADDESGEAAEGGQVQEPHAPARHSAGQADGGQPAGQQPVDDQRPDDLRR
jgi:hypothetical protein